MDVETEDTSHSVPGSDLRDDQRNDFTVGHFHAYCGGVCQAIVLGLGPPGVFEESGRTFSRLLREHVQREGSIWGCVQNLQSDSKTLVERPEKFFDLADGVGVNVVSHVDGQVVFNFFRFLGRSMRADFHNFASELALFGQNGVLHHLLHCCAFFVHSEELRCGRFVQYR